MQVSLLIGPLCCSRERCPEPLQPCLEHMKTLSSMPWAQCAEEILYSQSCAWQASELQHGLILGVACY